MKDLKWLQNVLNFIKKHSRAIIAMVVVISLLLSLSGISSIIALIRASRQVQSEAPTVSTTVPQSTEPEQTQSAEEQYELAVAYLNEAIVQTPEDPDLYTQRAALHYNLGQTEEALNDYTTALALKEDPRTRYLRAIVYSTTGNNQAAYEDLTISLQAEPNNRDYMSLMADICNALQHYDQALEYLEKLLINEPSNCVLLTLAGDACVYLQDFETATTHYASAIAAYTDSSESGGISKASLYSAYANALKTLENFTEAAEAYAQSLSLAESKELYFQRGFCLLQSENYGDAALDFTKCIELEYEVVAAHFQRALCYYAIGDYGKAIDDFKIYETAFPENADTFLYLGLCYQHTGRYQNAITYYQKCIAADISVGNCQFNIGNCYYNLKDYGSAVTYYTRAINSGIYVYESLLNRGVSYIQLNKYNEAKVDLKRVIDECKDASLVESATKSYDPIKNITIVTKS